uniref:Uncharacterized protein n=1 Tax=Tanacetum cinerariifolium TaxID=118510 RepID=A0A6L2M0C0_TANCI|nr:hypothetical protein [Tanacetum cinerariifolium]
MSTQQDIYAAGSESRPPMLNKENYIPWSSRLLRYAKSRPNGKLIHNSILNGPYPEWSRHVTIVHQTKDLHTADYTQLYDFLKHNQKEVDELKAKRLVKIQDPLALMVNSNNPYAFSPHQDQSSLNQNYVQQPMQNPKDITDPTTAMNMALALMAKAFKLNYSTPTNNNQRILSNPRNSQIAQPRQNAGNPAGYNDVIENQNQIGNGNLVAAHAEGNVAGQNGNQIRCYNCMGIGIQLQAEEYDLMTAVADLDDIEEVITNCILMANLQQASTSGTQSDNTPVYDTDGSVEVHKNYDNEIFNMFTQEEQYTELLEPILELHQVPQNDNDVVSEPEWSRHVTIVHQTKDMHTVDYTQLYDFLKYNQKEVDELKAERLAKNQDPLALMANSNNSYAFPAPHQDQSELLATTNDES